MKIPYKSLTPGSGIANYEVLDNAIVLEFVGGTHGYVYDRDKPGPIHLQTMIRLAN